MARAGSCYSHSASVSKHAG